MTRYHVSDVGDNTNGLTWAKAFNSITHATVLAATGGTDEIWVDKDHTEGATGVVNIAFTGGTLDDPIEVYSIDKDASDAYTPGALIDTTSTGTMTLSGHVRWFGIDMSCTNAAADLNFGIGIANVIELWDATFTAGDRLEHSVGRHLKATNCTFNSSDVTDGIRIDAQATAILEFRKCVFLHSATACFALVSSNNFLLVEDSDLSTNSDSLLQQDSVDVFNEVVFRRCKLKSGYSLYSDQPREQSFALVESSTSDTDATPLGLQEYANYFGTIKSTLVQRRTGGADDGVQANELSWVMVANTKTREFWRPLKTPPITVWVAGGSSLTFKIFIASAVTDLKDDEVWIELSGPDNTATSTTQGYRETTKTGWTTLIEGDPQATPADLTTDSVSAWSGANTGTKDEMSITYTPDQAGPVTIRVCLAKAAGATIYVDPKIEVT